MSDEKRNILFISSDQQHWMAMGYLNPEVKTPNLDRLVESGMTFHRAYTVNPTCTPTRASWITGLYPSQHGAYSLGTKLMEDVPTLGDAFQVHGYRTALVGKAHFQPLASTEEYASLESYPIMHDLDFWRGFHGPFYGFDHVELARNHVDEAHVGQHYALWMEEKAPGAWRDYFVPTPANLPEHDGYPLSSRQRPPAGGAWDIPEELHYDAWIAERTNALMEDFAEKGERFFLWASFFDPHPPYMVPEPYASMYDPAEVTVPAHREGEFEDKPPYFELSQQEKPDFSAFRESEGNGIHGAGSHLSSQEVRAKKIATMYGMMTMLDTYIGKILAKLDALGLTESTLVCFTTDHGDFLGQHGLTAKAIHHYEDLLRVPLVVSMPGTVPAGIVSDALQSTVDLPQTFLSVAGLPVPRHMAGVDEREVWTGSVASLRDHVIVENQHQPTTMNMRTFITQRYKLTIHFNRDYGELYDLEADPGEYTNLWKSPDHQGMKQDLLLKFLYGEMAKAPLPMPRIAGA
ncbi:MAG: sulfatase-like hydrolase/transferase [Kiritimatiellae bacterium]|nr:sulfatase-like hydrolase/transferase [Kiritimatiellia bacterium]